jgi:hypothetical protein
MKRFLSANRMRVKNMFCAFLLTGLGLAQQSQLPATVVFDNEYQQAGGCQDTGRQVSVKIPNADKLDAAVTDPTWHVPGITFRATTANGTSGIRNVRVNGDQLQYEIFAGGGGTKAGGSFGIPEFCKDASGGSYGVEVTAYYKASQTAKVITPKPKN